MQSGRCELCRHPAMGAAQGLSARRLRLLRLHRAGAPPAPSAPAAGRMSALFNVLFTYSYICLFMYLYYIFMYVYLISNVHLFIYLSSLYLCSQVHPGLPACCWWVAALCTSSCVHRCSQWCFVPSSPSRGTAGAVCHHHVPPARSLQHGCASGAVLAARCSARGCACALRAKPQKLSLLVVQSCCWGWCWRSRDVCGLWQWGQQTVLGSEKGLHPAALAVPARALLGWCILWQTSTFFSTLCGTWRSKEEEAGNEQGALTVSCVPRAGQCWGLQQVLELWGAGWEQTPALPSA